MLHHLAYQVWLAGDEGGGTGTLPSWLCLAPWAAGPLVATAGWPAQAAKCHSLPSTVGENQKNKNSYY